MTTTTETVRFIPTAGEDMFAVEVHNEDTVRTIGRVAKYSAHSWAGLGVGADAWTDYLPSRAMAVRDLRLGITFRTRPVR